MTFEFVTRSTFASNIVHRQSCDGNMNDYMHLSVRLLEVMGVFETVETKSSLIWSLKILVFISPTLIFFLSLVNELRNATNDMSHFNDILVMVLFGTMCLVKYAALLYFRERMKALRDEINDDMINGDKSKSDDLLIEHYDQKGFSFAKTVTKMLCCFATMVFVQNFADIYFGDERILPFVVSHPFSNSTASFLTVYALQFVAVYTYITIFVASNAWIIFLTYHACGHFCVLQKYLEQIADDEHWVEYQRMDARQRIVKCVMLHQNICRMAEDIEDFFTFPNFIHFLVSAVGICSSAYELSSGYTDMTQLVRHVTAICGQFALLFILNRCGQQIQDKSFGVSLAVYRSSFYKFEVQHQRDMALILMRSQRPMRLTACNFYILCLESIANILKASVSYFEMFRNFDQEA